MNAILFDIGGTKTRVAFCTDGESFEEPIVFETVKNYEEGFVVFVENIKKVANGRGIKKIVGGMSRSVGDWTYERLKTDLKALPFGEGWGGAVVIENDAAMVGLGEATHGAGRGFDIVAYITVSTGVGGARIVNQKIDEHAVGFEPGKQILNIEDNKTLEDLISGCALEKEFGKHPKEIKESGVWEDLSKKLAVGLYNIIVEWSPNAVVLGGSMITGDPAIPLDRTEARLKEIFKIFPELPAIKKAELADFGGLWGALAYLKSKKA